MQAGVIRECRIRQQEQFSSRQRLPVTIEILGELLNNVVHDWAMLRTAVTVRFLLFFKSGAITVPMEGSFNEQSYLEWGDVATDRTVPPTII